MMTSMHLPGSWSPRTPTRRIVAFFLALGFAACGGNEAPSRDDGDTSETEDCAIGAQHCACTEDGSCDAGLSCIDSSCVNDEDHTGDGGEGDGSGGVVTTGGTNGTGAADGTGGESSGGSGGSSTTGGTGGASGTQELSIYLMFDVSCSMSCTLDQIGCCIGSYDEEPESEWRITAVRAAVTSFLNDPANTGIRVGLGAFGNHPVEAPNDPEVCTVGYHSTPLFDFAQLPSVGLVSALGSLTPQGGTPTHLAIEGACSVVRQRKQEQPSENVVGLLLTDGIPELSCNADLQSTVTAAENCHDAGGGPRVYLLAVETNVPTPYAQLDDVAAAAGTGSLYLAEAEDVETNVLTQLYAIRDAALTL